MSTDDTVPGATVEDSPDVARRHRDGWTSVAELEPADNLGRYVILERLGAGAMGVVYAAYDPELDRKVAIKLLLRRARSQTAGQRLQREAQALAKLNHPNVVGVHDVGEHEGRVFVAMEFVAGQTLGAWLRGEPREQAAILAVFLAAGRGLAAAHRAGLVHRDFKPDNVMIDDEGRVRVMDFGLARADEGTEAQAEAEREAEGESREDAPTLEDHRVGTSALSARLTQTGALLGTPAYMAAEQFLGQRADARSDQFSFCVAMWEALFGERPFAGETAAALAFNVGTGERREPDSAVRVSTRVRRALERGLSADPDDRFASMEALLAVLQPPPERRGGWWAIAAIAGMTAVALGVVATRDRGRASEPPPACGDMAAGLTGAWDSGQRARVKAGLLGTELGYAEDTWTRVEAELDAWSADWVAQRTDACEATKVRGEQSDEAMDLRMACLDRRRDALVATVDVLAEADATVLGQAVVTARGLPTLDRCADVEALREREPLPEDPATAEAAEAVRRDLQRVHALGSAGKFPEALTLAREVEPRAATIDHPPTPIQAKLELGIALADAGEYQAAEQALTDAYTRALTRGMFREASAAAGRQIWVLSFGLARADEALGWTLHARAVAEATGEPAAVGVIENSLASAKWMKGDLEGAQALYERSSEILADARGPRDPTVAQVLQNRAILLGALGRTEEGRALAEQALEILEASLGAGHPHVARALVALGHVDYKDQDYAEALARFERALAITEAAFGPEHPDVVTTLVSIGAAAQKLGDFERARDVHERALPLTAAAFGEAHPEYARELANLGLAILAQGEAEDALAYFVRSVEIWDASETDGTSVGLALTGWGEALLALDRPAEALPPLERAVEVRGREGDSRPLALSRYQLARALWEAPPPDRDRVRARELAELVDDYDPAIASAGLGELARE